MERAINPVFDFASAGQEDYVGNLRNVGTAECGGQCPQISYQINDFPVLVKGFQHKL